MSIVSEVESAAVPGLGYVKTALKFAPFVAIALLIGVVLWLRSDINKTKGDLAVSEIARGDLQKANDADAKTIEDLKQRQADNDVIAAAVTKAIAADRQHTDATRHALKGLENDKAVRAWAVEPVPDGVRRELEGTPDGIPGGSR